MKIRFSLILITVCFCSQVFAGIETTKHNLSIGGGNAVSATAETEICIFCHTPHAAVPSAPLWNRTAGNRLYTPYSSTSMHSVLPGQPTGTSILCLSCHDGTIAIGSVVVGGGTTGIAMKGTDAAGKLLAGSSTNIGLLLSDDHPISFPYTAAGSGPELADPATLPASVKLDMNNNLQCTTCHDAHDNTNAPFLVMNNIGSALCETCHIKSLWAQSEHNTNTGTWNNVAPDPWPNSALTTVADNACGNCHAAHNAGVPERLFTQVTEEDVCFVCHNGNVAGLTNIQTDFTLMSHHKVELAVGVHQPASAEPVPAQQRHVECVDCHNAHEARKSPLGAVGITGIDWNGAPLTQVSTLDELCFKCHESSPNRPPATLGRNKSELNVRLEFNIGNPSFHPIRGFATTGSISLKPPTWVPAVAVAGTVPPGLNLLQNSCFDCHKDKPHGTTNASLLILNQVLTDGTPESPTTYELCYSCHDRNIILGTTSFKEHRRHIVNELAACTTCHTPHGASTNATPPATTTNNKRLINFRTTGNLPVTAVNGVLAWTPGTPGVINNTGSCTLSCHGEIHNPETY